MQESSSTMPSSQSPRRLLRRCFISRQSSVLAGRARLARSLVLAAPVLSMIGRSWPSRVTARMASRLKATAMSRCITTV